MQLNRLSCYVLYLYLGFRLALSFSNEEKPCLLVELVLLCVGPLSFIRNQTILAARGRQLTGKQTSQMYPGQTGYLTVLKTYCKALGNRNIRPTVQENVQAKSVSLVSGAFINCYSRTTRRIYNFCGLNQIVFLFS